MSERFFIVWGFTKDHQPKVVAMKSWAKRATAERNLVKYNPDAFVASTAELVELQRVGRERSAVSSKKKTSKKKASKKASKKIRRSVDWYLRQAVAK